MLRRVGCLALLVAALLPGLAGADTEAPGEAGWARSLPTAGRLWQALPPEPERVGPQLRRNAVNTVKLLIALGGAGVLLWGIALRRAGRPEAHRNARDGMLLSLGIASFFGWWNFLYFHYPEYVQTHDLFTYHLGSKYFDELGYQRLYDCIAVADAESGLQSTVERRLMTDLKTYELVDTRAILADPGLCKRHFSAGRWAEFQHDVGWFRSRALPKLWEASQRDHGYNATPVWGMLGGALARSGPISDGRLLGLALIDSVLELVMYGFVAWAFGWRALCVALIYRGTNHPAEYSWVGGSFLRHDWLATSVIAICLLRRRRPLGAGFLLGYATLLRLFPLLLWIPLGMRAVADALRRRSWTGDAPQRRLIAGALASLALLLPLSLLGGGGWRAWSDFTRNITTHTSVPGSNHMGLRTLLSFDPDTRMAVVETTSPDPGGVWKEGRRRAFERRRPLFWLAGAGFLALLYWAVRRQDDWVAAVLGIGCIPLLLEPSSYYTSVLFAYGLLWTRHEGIGVALCLLSAVCWGIAAVWGGWDDIFVASSAAVVAFVVYATLAVGRSNGAEETDAGPAH